eukprot:TRINITY_DN10932_c0_g1_i1.p1 TRINITY_DN10932_c0_g1~~TRINITY_DN10932_c0_g1_i1.p1  ORF type:complete len:469 (+),score=86.96 TRINITY_DN10932_c0_g1_i1:363-1769(+)
MKTQRKKTAAEIKETCKGVSVKTIKPDSSEKNSGKTEKYSIAILENIKESQFEDVKKIIEETCGIAEFTPLTDNRTKTFRSAVRLQCEDLDKTDDVITAINTAKLGKIRAVKRMKTAGEERGPEKPDEKKQDKERYFIGNLPRIPDAQQLFTSELREICGAKLASFKLLKNEMNLPNGCAIVTFAKKKQEAAAVRSIQDGKIIVSGRTVRVEQKQTADQLSKNTLLGDKNTVFVANLPLTLTEDQIIFALKKFGEIETVNMNFGDSGFNGTARVTYTHLDSVTKAVQHSGVFLINRRPIRIDLDKKKAARSAQLDLNSTLSTAKTILVSPVTNGMQLQAVAVKKLFSDLGKVKYSRKSLPEDTPGEEIPDGSITLCFTSSACVAIAMQMVGHEVECEGDKPPPKSGIVIKVIGLESGKQQARPKEISFTFNGARHWNTKEWVKQKRIETLESWNQKSSYGTSATQTWW